MYVSQLIVKGYRSLANVSVTFHPGLNVLVGKNNAGKSNIIQALDLILGERSPGYQDPEDRDFYRPGTGAKPTDTFLIAVKLEGQGFSQQVLVDENVGGRLFSLESPPDWDDYDGLASEPNGGWNWSTGPDLLNRLLNCREVWLYLVVPQGGGLKDRTLGACWRGSNATWSRFHRFKDDFRDALLTTARVPSFRDPSQQFRINQFSWYGKLIKKLYESKSPEQDRQIRSAQDAMTATVNEVFAEATTDLRAQLADAIFHHRVSFKPGAYTSDEAHKQITIFIDDGLDAPSSEKGSGIQSALIMALFAYYCRRFHHGGSLLLAEEPEIYLHPQARRAIEAQLVRFATADSDGGDNDANRTCSRQVIISTHATEFLRSAKLNSITCVRKPPTSTETTAVQIRSSFDQTTLRRWRQIMQTKNAEMFFADHVILVEGGEEYILPPLADLCFEQPRWLDTHNVSVVRADGKKQFKAYAAVLDELEIPYTILTDLDFVYEGLDSFANRFDAAFAPKLNHVKAVVGAGQAKPRGRNIRDAFSPATRDWVKLYDRVNQSVDDLCNGERPTEERLEEIRQLWSQLEDRISTPDIRRLLGNDPILPSLLTHAKDRSIFILPLGDLEDYLTDAMPDQDPSKDRRALAVAESLADCASLDDAREFINYDEFVAVLDHVATAIGSPRRIDTPLAAEPEDESGEAIPF